MANSKVVAFWVVAVVLSWVSYSIYKAPYRECYDRISTDFASKRGEMFPNEPDPILEAWGKMSAEYICRGRITKDGALTRYDPKRVENAMLVLQGSDAWKYKWFFEED